MEEKKPSIFNKIAKRLLVGGALLAVVHTCVAPEDRGLDPAEDYKPNDVQQEFMRLVAGQYDYVALGDTDHTRAEISMFALDTDTIGALADGGQHAVFLERGPRWQHYIDAIRTDWDSVQARPDDQRHAGGTMWICDAESKTRLNENFEESVAVNLPVQFYAADQRHAEDNDVLNDFGALLTIGVPLALYSSIYGCVDTAAFIPGAIVSAFTGVGEDTYARLTDDRLTAQFIESQSSGGGTIFYGAGHFMRTDENGLTLVHQFENAGRSVAVINVHPDDHHRLRSRAYREGEDAALVIDDDNDPQHGVRAYSALMQELYELAKRNVAARATMQP